MCGVFALFLRRPLQEDDIALGRAGTDMLRHRGPDHGGEWSDAAAGVFLGHRRLKIIDLSAASHQPFVRDGLALSYNGELYNYRALRDRLAGKVRFTTTGDTEVLLRCWQERGEAALDDFDGMLAIALWDGDAATLAVDRFGEKHLYYAETPDGTYVSSELGPLVSILRPAIAAPEQWQTAFLALGFIPAPATAFSGIRRLGPAEVLRIERGVAQAPRRYWQPAYGTPGRGTPQPLSENDLDRVQATLVESVRLRLEADVEPCIFLSGGIDSSLVAAILARDLGRRAATVTVSFPTGATHDEADDARRIAGHLGLEHQVLQSEDAAESVGTAYYYGLFGQPNDNLTVASVHQMAHLAAQRGFRLALTGTGGDEIFYGYMKHKLFYERARAFALPETLRLAAGALLRPFAKASSGIAAFVDLCAVPDAQRYLAVKHLPAFAPLQTLPRLAKWAADTFGGWRNPLYAEVARYDLEHVLVNSQLTTLDVGSMRASLEMRTPFLSRPLQELVATFDPRSLLAFGQKSVLRRLLLRYLPRDIAEGRKRGFSFPPDRFLRHFHEVPAVASVPAATARTIWRRRDEARAWRRLATRLVLAEQFPRWVETLPRALPRYGEAAQ